MRTLYVLAGVSLLVGGVLLFSPVLSVSSLTADRGVSVSTAPDESALIALSEADYDELDHQSFETIGTLENNVGNVLAVDYILSADHDGVTLAFDGHQGNPIDDNLQLATAEEIDMQCDSPGQMDGPVTVTAEIIDASDGKLSIMDAEMDLTVNCDGELPADGDVEFVSLEVTAIEHNRHADRVDSVSIEWEINNPDEAEYIQFNTDYTDPEEVDPDAGYHEINTRNNDFPIDVTADIDGGERCEFTFEAGGTQTLEDCR